ncbi:winged helix-turn-helix domain-containing protein [Sinorhizobium meliloti]|uniref:winged helix-turn-helix domain-containing protein n=1 Tax=Rhizobium meliloti TaxID=382 RepID=UPI000FD8CCA6|nr:winged helix-turn-helix domain-containing protein [Sinorhizobium meliloti]RVH01337.1 response regulator [Sinorhizobium meliloti]RVH11542.1 response regulator [Sinorhizobium meliloti]RVH53178.1 response regulator [Sinorhizobium meliloti]RVI55265.1 response regulator [Sinorhizobium meliloti]
MGARILVVEDDEPLRLTLEHNLRKEGFTVDGLARGNEAEARIGTSVPDALVLEWSLPGISGIDLCRRLRTRAETLKLPIVLLTDVADEDERIAGLSAGADDCLVKPFSITEFVVRVKNLLRRTNPALLDHMIKVGDLTLDRAARRVHRQRREIKLGPTEYKLLEFLMSSPGKVYSRSELRASVWGDDATVDERAVDVHIGRLRKGIGLGKADTVIRTIRGAGYALNDY